MAALKALVNSVPVIFTFGGGFLEVNIHAETDYLSDFGDVEEMANYAISILEDEITLYLF